MINICNTCQPQQNVVHIHTLYIKFQLQAAGAGMSPRQG